MVESLTPVFPYLSQMLVNALILAIFLLWLRKDFLYFPEAAGYCTKTRDYIKLLVACFLLLLNFSLYNLSFLLLNFSADPKQEEPTMVTLNEAAEKSMESHAEIDIQIIPPNKITTTFQDIAGLTESKNELKEIIHFLHHPEKFKNIGATMPKGIILYGLPGTGKTLLARAIAGESKVNFISISGSAFDEQWVGVGAARVRELFKIAQAHKPCIIFIDEIDALAPSRDAESSEGHLQTINQLLFEMDNIDEERNSGIMMVAATNRLTSIDPAVLRPGRFDRKIYIRLPNREERKAIIQYLLTKIKFESTLNIDQLAGTTQGFSGADIKNLLNEAAIKAVINNQVHIQQADIEYAKDKIILGLEVTTFVPELDRKNTAYHEAGHVIVGLLLPNYNERFNKVTIGLRDDTLGVTHFELKQDMFSYRKDYLADWLSVMYAGRAAEEIAFGPAGVTTGASADVHNATELARKMVVSWGLGEPNSVLLNYDVLGMYPESEVHAAITNLLKNAYAQAQAILTKHESALHALAEALLAKEILNYQEVIEILSVHIPELKDSLEGKTD
jgi:cell division protease FtsH